MIFCSSCSLQPVSVSIDVVYGTNYDNYTINTGELFENKNKVTLNEAINSLNMPTASTAAVYTADGDILYTDTEKVEFNRKGQAKVEGKNTEKIVGIILDYPDEFVGTVYEIAKEALCNNEKVMILYLDGFGYDSFELAKAKGIIQNLDRLNVQKAAAVFPTITPVNYAAMVTGQTPKYTGVIERSDHLLNCDSIFDLVLEIHKTACIIEGDKQIIKFSVEQELNPDFDGDGDTDNEVYKSAIKAIKNNDYDLLFVHFHGIDDISHQYGPQTDETMQKIADTDFQVGKLIELWNGKIIVIADHGQHSSNDGEHSGNHGTFTSQDLFVPLLIN